MPEVPVANPQDLLVNIGYAIAVAAGLSFLAHGLKQPLILAYLAAGVVLGPIGFEVIKDKESIEAISEIGLILLLFMIGLEMDLKGVLASGRAVLVTGVFQFGLCVAMGLGFFTLLAGLDFPHKLSDMEVLYLSAATALSSTLIVVKLLYDKQELDTLAGRISLGVLVFQDLFAIVMLAIQPNLKDPRVMELLPSVGYGVALVVGSVLVSRFFLTPLFREIARSPELVLLASLAWCFVGSALAGLAGLSSAMGALLAGISLSTFPYTIDVAARTVSIRDFFVILFFVSLGMSLEEAPSLGVLAFAVSIFGFVALSRLLSVMTVLRLLRMDNRVGLVTSINLANISEFSIVLAALGLELGHIDKNMVATIIVSMAIGAVLSTYMINYSHQIYLRANPVLRWVFIKDPSTRVAAESAAIHGHGEPKSIVMLGFHRVASSLLQSVEAANPELLKDVLVIDYNPQVYRELRKRGVACVYGDIGHLDTLRMAGVEHAQLVLSTIPDTILKGTSNLKILEQVRRLAPKATIVCTAESVSGALELYRKGAHYVFLPQVAAAEDVMKVMTRLRESGLEDLRQEHIKALTDRNEVI